MVRVNRYIIAVCLALLTARSVAASDYSDCSILSRSGSELTFVYRPASFTWQTNAYGAYPGIPNTALEQREGEPQFVGRVVYIAVPPGTSHVEAEIISLGALETIAPPVPTTHAPAVSLPYPATRVVVNGFSTLRGVRLVRLILHPAVVVSPDGTVEFAHEMTVSVRMHGGDPSVAATPSRGGPFAAIFNEILLNPEDARVDANVSLQKIASAENPFAGGSQWVAIRTRGDGVHAVTASALSLAGVNIGAVDPAAIRLFAGPGRQLSTKVSQPGQVLTETAIEWQGDADASIEIGERFIFWADGLNRWDVDSLGRLVDVVHRYDRDNVYWLALSHSAPTGPKRIGTLSAPPLTGAVDLFTGIERARHEEENNLRVAVFSNVTESYYTWYWRNQRDGVITFFNSRNPADGMPATVEMGTWVGRANIDHPKLRVNGTTILPSNVREFQGEDRSHLSTFRFAEFDPNASYELFFEYLLPDEDTAHNYLDFYTLEYHRNLDLTQGPLKFAAPDTTLDANLVIANAASARLWDITDPENPREISDAVREGTTLRFGASLIKGQRRVFYVLNESSLRVPRSHAIVPIVDLHTPATGADYLAIGPDAFNVAMADFLSYRGNADGMRTRFVALEDIYNSFSLGIQDPLAMRRFLAHTHTAWPGETPYYCLIVGDGTHDFLNNTGASSVNLVPPYVAPDDNTVSDENFVYFSDRQVLDSEGDTQENPLPDMIVGRWPVRTAEEIAAVTAKIKAYESTDELGSWRSRVLMVADDEFGQRGFYDQFGNCIGHSVREEFHINDAEAIANSIPSRFRVDKVYLTEYPFDNPGCTDPCASGCLKPAAKAAMLEAVNAGALVLDYIGHGSPNVLAHERVFEREIDIPRLTNARTPTAFFAFSCSIANFDDPERQGMGEELMRMPQGGAIAVVSATRLVGSRANAELNTTMFDMLFRRGIVGLGAAAYTAKVLRQYTACRTCAQPPCPCNNDRNYVLFGDPAMRLGEPILRVQFTTVDPDSLSALTTVAVQGRITDTAGTIQGDFDGTLFASVHDVPRRRVYPINDEVSINYELPGGTLFRGQVPVRSGQFEFSFIVPKDIAYGQTGAAIVGHAVTTATMANGSIDTLHLASSPASITDTAGPVVRLQTEDGETIADGFLLAEDAGVVALVEDPSGINLTGSSGHRIAVFVDGIDVPFADLTNAFVYDPGSADRGRAVFSVAGIERGRHQLTLKVWDNANNSSSKSYDIELVAAESDISFSLTEFLNHPNPFADATTFYFRATRAIREAHIRLFTLAGRMIWEASATDGVTTWDGRDNTGDKVANGVYLAQLEAIGEVLSDEGQLVDKRAYREMKVVVSR